MADRKKLRTQLGIDPRTDAIADFLSEDAPTMMCVTVVQIKRDALHELVANEGGKLTHIVGMLAKNKARIVQIQSPR
jgi:hypothetical protein